MLIEQKKQPTKKRKKKKTSKKATVRAGSKRESEEESEEEESSEEDTPKKNPSYSNIAIRVCLKFPNFADLNEQLSNLKEDEKRELA